jgi:hypothetical protein
MKRELVSENPRLLAEWHPTRNRNITPYDATQGSGKKVWWKCEKGHEWEATVYNRSNGTGCPFCSGKRACIDNSLQTLRPDLAKEWYVVKNGKLTTNCVTPNFTKKVWWKCDECNNVWEMRIHSRSRGAGCPECRKLKRANAYRKNQIKKKGSLLDNNPELSKQWHPIKNGGLTPESVTSGSGEKVWWCCEMGHEWKAVIASVSKSNNGGCPVCYREYQTSFQEQAIYLYMKSVFSDVINRYKFDGKEIDIFIPRLKFGVEYRGFYYHKNRENKNSRKDSYIINKGVHLLIIKEIEECKVQCYLKNNIIYCPINPSDSQLNEIIMVCFNYLSENITHKKYNININVKRDGVEINTLFITHRKENNLRVKYPELAKQWHTSKNRSIEPDMVASVSGKRFWWQCSRGHEWQASVASRTNLGSNCPYCSGQRVCADNCLQVLNPKLAEQWHPAKNGDFTPNDVTTGSNKKVWWQCNKRTEHEWEASVNNRTNGYGCPFCTGQRVCADNSLQTLFPDISRQWHPTKNLRTPNDYTSNSGIKVWWKCERGHEWEARIACRTKENATGCPYCAGQRVCTDNCLQTLKPELARQWHNAKNNKEPSEVTTGSGYKTWWICEKGHEWKSSVRDRSRGSGCPFCSGKRVCNDNCLYNLFPKLAKQWHPTMNGDLTSKDVTEGSSKKVWWKCDKDHEWEASVANRVKGTGCPHCFDIKRKIK